MGLPEQIAIAEYSAFCDYGKADELVSALQRIMSMKQDKMAIAATAHKYYAIEEMVTKYLQLYQWTTQT